jgi:hypothetical protein
MMHQSLIKKIMIVSAAVLVLLLFFVFDARNGSFPACPFLRLTGFYCPGCGSQRAVSSLMHGDLVDAFSYNSLLVLTLPLLVYALIIYLKKNRQLSLFYTAWFPKLLFVVVILFWITRNIPSDAFRMLAPHSSH